MGFFLIVMFLSTLKKQNFPGLKNFFEWIIPTERDWNKSRSALLWGRTIIQMKLQTRRSLGHAPVASSTLVRKEKIPFPEWKSPFSHFLAF